MKLLKSRQFGEKRNRISGFAVESYNSISMRHVNTLRKDSGTTISAVVWRAVCCHNQRAYIER